MVFRAWENHRRVSPHEDLDYTSLGNNEARATMLRASSHTRFARPAIFGDDFLRIELEETGEVVPILFPSISVVFSLALGFAICLSLFHSLSSSFSLFRFVRISGIASLSVTLICSCVITSISLFLCVSFYLPVSLSLSFSLSFFLSLYPPSIPSLRHR